MLINLLSEGVNFDLPEIYFERNQLICVTEIFIEFKDGVKRQPAIILSSSLIDKSTINPKQQLVFIHQKKNSSNYIFYTPTHKDYYKIQCPDLKSSQFKLIDLIRDKNVENIKKIYIQLEVINGV